MFSGFRTSTIDAKGRIKFPSDYHKQMIQLNLDEQFMCTRHPSEHCLMLYPVSYWQDIAQKVNQLPIMNNQAKLIKRYVLGYATECELDSQVRVLVPKSLREAVPMEKKICLSGQGNGIEVWSENAWQDSEEKLILLSKQEPMTRLVSELSL